jgi:copper chaperone NosL
MKRIAVLILITAAFFIFGTGALAQTGNDATLHKACSFCGMDRGQFDFSRMLIEYDDGSVAASCSIHCAAIDLAVHIDKMPKSILVGDFKGRQLIDAEKAFWVVGGIKPGVMSRRGKWAFENKDQAENFLKTNQGRLASFDEAMKAAYEDMAEDTKLIREKRKMRRMKMREQKSPGDQ